MTEFRSNKIKAGKQIGMNKKQQFLNVTYEILNEEGVAGVSIRRLAKEVGCTSTVIYRYFDNVEHLIIMASVRYLERYIADFKRYTKEIRNPLELNLTLWERFDTYALEKVDVFEMLFFGKYKESLVDIIYEYYELFSEKFENMDGLLVSVVFNGNIRERDYIMYRRAASMGYIELDAAEKLSYMDAYMFHGLLMEYKFCKLEKEEIEMNAKKFTDIIRSVVEKFRIR